MAQVIIRNLDDNVVAALKRKAEGEHKSLEQKLREVLTHAVRPTAEELIEESRQIRSRTKPTAVDPADLIRQDRDSR